MSNSANMKAYRVRYLIPNTSNPRQETVIRAGSAFIAKRIFEMQFPGCKLSEMPQEIREQR